MKDLSTAESTADVVSYMRLVGTQAKAAARVMARATTAAKNMALNAAADAILAQQEQIIAANAADVSNARQNGHDAAFVDRLVLSKQAIGAITEGLRQVASLPDPVGAITATVRRPSGIEVGHMRVPLGVIGMIYESRPNVTADADRKSVV